MSDKQVQIKITGDASGLSSAVKQGSKDLDHLGISAKQTAAAIRGVPAQFTDIFVSLQGGQSPMQVFFQQGGQLKDMFGGTGAAAKALSTYILGLISPLTIAAAAVGGLGAVLYLGSEQSTRLQNALVMSGNAAGKTLGQMDDLAESVGQATGQYSLAREATEALAASGKISSENIQSALDGVLAGVKVTGKSAEELVTDFEAIGKDPVAAIKKLNENYNFLTVDIYKQISSLEEQGKHQEAVTLATDTFANTMETRSKQVIDNAGLIEKSWLGIKSAIGGAIDQLESIGRTDSLGKQVINAQIEVNNLKAHFKQQQGVGGLLGVSEKDILEAQTRLEKLQKDLIQSGSEAAEKSRAANDNKNQIAAQDAAKKYVGSDSSYSKSGLLGHQLQQENDDFNKIIINLKKGTKEYEDVLTAHENRVANIKDAAAKRNKEPKETNNLYIKEMKDVASLAQEIGKLDDVEITQVQRLQEKLDAHTNLDPALQKYLQNQLDLAKAAEQEASWQKIVNDNTDREIEAQNALADAEQKAADDREKSFQDLSASIEKENEDLNIALIKSDTKRAKAQIELEHERALDRINGLMLESEQAQELIDAETKNYELKLKGIDQGLKGTKSMSKELGMTFSSAFEDAIVKGEKFSTVLQSLAQDIEKLALRKAVTEPLMGAISGYMDNFDFNNVLGSAPQGSAGTGDGIIGYFSGLFGGGRASGGSVSNGKFYEVNENSPELLTSGGRTYLMMGANDGHVTPPKSISGQSSMQSGGNNTNVTVNLIESPGNGGQVNQTQNGNNLTLDIMVEKIEGIIGRNISQGRGIAPTMERQYGLNRAAGAY